jgi:phosphatidate cytidylyltransferase
VQALRWLTALILLGIVVPLIVWGEPLAIFGLIALVVILGQWEYDALRPQQRASGWRIAGVLISLVIPAGAFLEGERGLLMGVVGALMVWMVVEMVARPSLDGVLSDLGARMLGYLHCALLPAYFLLLRRIPDGVHWVLFTMVITAVGDTAAYYAGSLWGRRRLMPRISPKKTVEGAAAGLLGNLGGALAYLVIVFPTPAILPGLLLAILVGVAGQLGDLSESMLKRGVGLKDSSGLLPGHGGVLDRLDSLLFSVPVVYYWATL